MWQIPILGRNYFYHDEPPWCWASLVGGRRALRPACAATLGGQRLGGDLGRLGRSWWFNGIYWWFYLIYWWLNGIYWGLIGDWMGFFLGISWDLMATSWNISCGNWTGGYGKKPLLNRDWSSDWGRGFHSWSFRNKWYSNVYHGTCIYKNPKHGDIRGLWWVHI